MQRSVKMKDVARAAGVSVMTVSRAFRKDASVRPETRDAILKVAEDLGYVFDSTAANLRSQKTDFVAVTIPSINNANFAETVAGLSEVLSNEGLQVLLAYTNYDIAQEERAIEQLLRRRPEAIVVTGGKHTPRARRLLEGAGIPVVEAWDLPADPIGHVVGFSNAATMEAMVDHLVAQGYTRIAFIGGDADADTRGADRRRGFIAAMAAHGLTCDRLIEAGPPPISMREGAEAMGRLLDMHPDTQAVVCVSDLSAFGALTECQRRGLGVPRDIAVAGFGAYEIANVCVPTLTTVDPFPRSIGEEVANLILHALDHPGERLIRKLSPRLVIAASTQVRSD
ncbi:LacI family DNA-binding transcriptional regulator [Halovulum dunhuangense]|uniref:LacI family DNA-binding transcriptional regulator n=1 Tax=Halovulum dunhuangense TaxID=1505036 RepID=A0A849L2D2_9RHOB|nr:LacI family DNA-binding transcriptional regulator [Halovulum dunhuangense]NNU80423.1 LacI family DNA-binding transcriptional regulator [Halovulum dunhuangense]